MLAQIALLPEQTQTLVEELVSTLPPQIQHLLSYKGQCALITYGRECKMRAGKEMIYKVSEMIVRMGINYDNIAAVKDKRESGELPKENAGLLFGNYVAGLWPYIVEYEDNLYVRVFTVPNNPTVIRKVSYIRNDVEITKEEAQKDCLASEFADRGTSLETLLLKLNGILSVNGSDIP